MADNIMRRDSDSQNGKDINNDIMMKQERGDHLNYAAGETRMYEDLMSKEDEEFYHAYPQAARDKAYFKVDIRLVPMLALLYLFSFMDRANIGNAKIEGMNADIGLTGVQYNIVSSIFFVTYVIFEIPANSILQKYFSHRPSLWIGIITMAWGVVMTFHGVVQNFAGLMSARLVLGMAEAGFYPGALLICAKWYPRFRLQKRVALFYMSSAFAGALSGLLAFAIAKMDGVGGYEGWRWIFIIEGIATVVVGVVTPFVLADSPARSKWLSDDERRFIELAMVVQDGSKKNTALTSKVTSSVFKQVFTDWQLYVQGIIYWSNTVPNNAFKFTLPTIIKQMGYTSAKAQLMTIPVYCFGAISAFGTAWFADRYKRRMPFIVGPQLVVVLAYAILFPLAPNISNRIAPCYVALCIACLGFYPINPGGQAWTANNLAGPAKRGIGLAFLTSMGNIGGVVGSYIFIEKEAPAYPTGYGASIAFAGLGAIAALGLEFALIRINRNRDKITREEIMAKYTEEELALLGDRSPLFRYTL